MTGPHFRLFMCTIEPGDDHESEHAQIICRECWEQKSLSGHCACEEDDT